MGGVCPLRNRGIRWTWLCDLSDGCAAVHTLQQLRRNEMGLEKLTFSVRTSAHASRVGLLGLQNLKTNMKLRHRNTSAVVELYPLVVDHEEGVRQI